MNIHTFMLAVLEARDLAIKDSGMCAHVVYMSSVCSLKKVLTS